MRKPRLTVFNSCLLLLTAACSGKSGPDVRSLAIASADTADIENGTLLVVRDKGTLLRVVAKDDSGAEVELDPGDIRWEATSTTTLELTPLGGSCIVKGLQDWFDTVAEGDDPSTGHEPSDTLTVWYDDNGSGQLDESEARAQLPVSVVLNGEGNWMVKITGGTLNGVSIPLDLVQHGRTLGHEATGAMAQIVGNTFSIAQLGFSFSGDFSSRTTISGEYMDDSGGQGTWEAEKK
jgi:hypothetical protein